MDGSPVLWCKDLRKIFKERLAVDGVGFEVAPGETYGLLGPSVALYPDPSGHPTSPPAATQPNPECSTGVYAPGVAPPVGGASGGRRRGMVTSNQRWRARCWVMSTWTCLVWVYSR
jgi:hypothetical protein